MRNISQIKTASRKVRILFEMTVEERRQDRNDKGEGWLASKLGCHEFLPSLFS